MVSKPGIQPSIRRGTGIKARQQVGRHGIVQDVLGNVADEIPQSAVARFTISEHVGGIRVKLRLWRDVLGGPRLRLLPCKTCGDEERWLNDSRAKAQLRTPSLPSCSPDALRICFHSAGVGRQN